MEIYRDPRPIKYFNLVDYVGKIKLSDRVLYHLEDTTKSFEEYMKILGEISSQDDYAVLYYWLDQNYHELCASSEMEKKPLIFTNEELLADNLFFDSLNVTEKRLKDIHTFVSNHSGLDNKAPAGEYRQKPVWVGAYNPDGTPDIFWHGCDPKDILKFMKSYIEFYKHKSLSNIYTNPFLKAALAQILLIRIQPFGDGNKRTSRIVQNISFTSDLNKFYGTKLRLSPLNISMNLKINQLSYSNNINRVVFNIDDDPNDGINNWFDFILNMYDEQLFFQKNNLPKLEQNFRTIALLKDAEADPIAREAEVSKLKKFLK